MRTLVMLGLLVALAGCGWTSTAPANPEQAVRAALQEYRDARLAGDPQRACAALSAAARSALENSFGANCPKAGYAYDDTEPIHARRWRITSIRVRGDRATVRLAPGRHVVDRRLTLVREPDGWKLERDVESMSEQAPWEHCVLKLTADGESEPVWQRLGADTHLEYTERYCDAVRLLPAYPSDADYRRIEAAIRRDLIAEGKLTERDAEELR